MNSLKKYILSRTQKIVLLLFNHIDRGGLLCRILSSGAEADPGGGYDGSGGTDPDGAGKVEADPADEEGDRGK